MSDSTLYVDELTGVYNRRYLKEKQEQEIQTCIKEKKPVCIAMVDIDHFKEINDSHGYITGDTLLKEFTRFLTASLRRSDTVIRYGGEDGMRRQ